MQGNMPLLLHRYYYCQRPLLTTLPRPPTPSGYVEYGEFCYMLYHAVTGHRIGVWGNLPAIEDWNLSNLSANPFTFHDETSNHLHGEVGNKAWAEVEDGKDEGDDNNGGGKGVVYAPPPRPRWSFVGAKRAGDETASSGGRGLLGRLLFSTRKISSMEVLGRVSGLSPSNADLNEAGIVHRRDCMCGCRNPRNHRNKLFGRNGGKGGGNRR